MTDLTQQYRDAKERFDALDSAQTVANKLTAKDPDAIAAGRQAAEEIRMPAAIADLDPKQAEHLARVKRYRDAVNASPRLKEWLQQRQNAALAHDDAETLSFWESATGFGQSFAAGIPTAFGLGIQGIGRTAQQEPQFEVPESLQDSPAMRELGRQFDKLGHLREGLGQILVPAGEAVEEFGQAIDVAPEDRTLGNDISGAFGQLVGQVGLFLAGPTGQNTALALFFGQGVEHQRRLQEENGLDPDSNEAKAGQLAGGVVTLVTERLGIGVLLSRIPGLRSRVGALLAEAGKGTLAEGSQEVTESVIQQAIANALTEGDQELFRSLWREFVIGGSAGGLFAFLRELVFPGWRRLVAQNEPQEGPGPLDPENPANLQSSTPQQAAQQAEADRQTLHAINENVRQSKLAERSPADFERYLDEATKGGRDTVYAPAEDMLTYFQRSGRDAEQAVENLGLNFDEVVTAATAGVRVAIPTSTYAARVAVGEDGEWFADNASFSPTGQTVADLANVEAATALRQQAEEQQADIDAELALRAGDAQIADEVAGEFRQAGVSAPVARQVSEAVSAFFRTLGARAGEDPLELYRRFGGLRVRGELVDRLNQLSRDELDKLIDLARAGKTDPTVQRQESLVPFLQRIGIRDDAGELEAIGAERLVRPGGVDIETAAFRAADEGFLPELKASLESQVDLTLSPRDELLKAVDSELRGKPVRVDDPAADDAEAQAAAVSDLLETADQLGIDLDRSNAEIKRQLSVGLDTNTFSKKSGDVLRGFLQTPASGLGPDTPATIFLTKDYDLSTALHELGHYFLEINLAVLRSGQEAPGVSQDMEAIKAWWGRNADAIAKEAGEGITADEVQAFLETDLVATTDRESAIWTGMHEQFARGFESYLFTGKAPSAKLQDAFRRFKAWLLLVYRQVRALGVKLDKDARDTFDRMLATDEELADAEALSGKQPVADDSALDFMSPKQREEYLKATREALERGRESVLRELLQELQKAQTAEFKALREETRNEAFPIVNSRPVYRAWEWLQFGRWHGDGQPVQLQEHVRLNKQALIELDYGGNLRTIANRAAGNDILPAVYAAEGGVDPDAIAGWFGFRSGDQMVRAMLEAPKRADAIEQQTDDMLMERVGDMLRDGRLEEAALSAVHGEPYADAIESEIKALAVDRPSLVSALRRQAQAQAKQMAETWTPRQAQESAYLAAERRSAEQSRRALQRGKRAEAAQLKQRQLLNHYLWREAKQANEQLDKLRALVAKLRKKSVREAIGQEYTDQIYALLDKYDFTRLSRRDERARKSLIEFVGRMNAEGRGHEVDIPPAILQASSKRPFNKVPISELMALGDALRNLEHLGKLKTKLLLEKKRRELELVVDEVETAILDNTTPAAVRIGRGSKLDQVKDRGQQFVNLMLNPDTILRDLDGGKAGGPVHEHLKRPIDRAVADKFLPMQEKMHNDLERLQSVYGKSERRQMNRPREILGLPAPMTRWQMISVLLNWGSESSREALLEGGPLDESMVRIVFGQLDKRDFDFAQSVWDYLDSYWPQIAELETLRKGKAPERVVPAPVETPHGTYRGGYYPLHYDAGKCTKVSEEDVIEAARNLMAGRFSRAQTARGHTIERVGSGGRPVLLEMSVLHRHLHQVAHDLALGEAVQYVNRVLQHPRVRRALEGAGRQETWRTLDLWLKDTAAGELPANDIISAFARRVRVGFTASVLGFNFSTALLQPLGILQTAVAIGKRNALRGVVKLATSPWQGPQSIFKTVYEISPFMKSRATSFNKDIAAARRALQGKRLEGFSEAMFYMIVKTQQVVDMATWLGAYAKGQQDFAGDQEKARDLADSMVKKSQASGIFSDRSGLERGTTGFGQVQSESVKALWTTLASYMLAKSNVGLERTRTTDFRKPGEVLNWTLDMSLLFVVEGILIALLRGTFPDDEDESPGAFVAKESVSTVLAGIPFVREFAAEAAGFRGGGAITGFLEATGKAFEQIDQGEIDAAALKSINNVGGVWFAYPSRQINRTVEAFVRAFEGEDVAPIDFIMWRQKD